MRHLHGHLQQHRARNCDFCVGYIAVEQVQCVDSIRILTMRRQHMLRITDEDRARVRISEYP